MFIIQLGDRLTGDRVRSIVTECINNRMKFGLWLSFFSRDEKSKGKDVGLSCI